MQGKREFNIKQKWDFLSKADMGKRQVEHFHEMVREWINEYSDLASYGIASSAKNYYDNLDKVLGKSKNDINKIYEAAEQVENDYAEKFGNIAFEMSLYANRINALLGVLQSYGLVANVFDVNTVSFHSRLAKAKRAIIKDEIDVFIANPGKLEHLNLENYDTKGYINYIKNKYHGREDIFDTNVPNHISDVERDLLIMCYEYLHPKNTKKMNDFLDPVIKDGNYTKDVQNIKYLSYASPEPYKKILFQYLSQITIADYAWTSTQHYHPWDSSVLDSSDGHSGQSIAVNLNVSKALEDPTGPYFTFFHEIGHAMDHMMKEDGVFIRADSGLQDILKNDLHDNIRNEINSIPNTLTQERIDDIINSFAVGGTTLAPGSIEEQIRGQIIITLSNNLRGNERCTVSDVVGGFTNNTIVGGWSHGLLKADGVTPTYYWTDASGKETGAQSSEWFAGFFSANITGYIDQKNAIYDFFPSGAKFTDKVLTKVAKDLESE